MGSRKHYKNKIIFLRKPKFSKKFPNETFRKDKSTLENNKKKFRNFFPLSKKI